MGLSPRIEAIEADVATNAASTDSLGDKTSSMDQADAPLISVPHTDIIGRAPIRDLSKIPSPKMGVERVLISRIELLPDESGPNNESVFKAGTSQSMLDNVRFYGQQGVGVKVTNNAAGDRVELTLGASVEITFYGTGLNVLSSYDNTTDRGYDVYFNNVSEGSIDTVSGSVTSSQGYSANTVFNAVSGKTLGVHTVRLENANSVSQFAGFEIINETTTIDVPENSAILVDEERHLIPANQNLGFALASDFDSASDDPTTDGKGGAVVVYSEKSSDGTVTVKQRFNATDSTQKDLTLADHSNENVIKRINWREFKYGPSFEHFGNLSSSTESRTSVLPDGTTTLAGADVSDGAENKLRPSASGDFFTLTFVGTGLDLMLAPSAATGTTFQISINGSITGILNTSTIEEIYSIVSGLPYGTHTCRVDKIDAGSNLGLTEFIVYGPSMPSIPDGTGKLGSYYLMADFSRDTSADSWAISQGVLRKQCTMEFHYVGSWIMPAASLTNSPGRIVYSGVNGAYVEYSFFGTGIELEVRSSNGINDATIHIDDALFTGTATATGGTFSAGTWSNIPGSHGTKITLEGLALGHHTVKMTKSTADVDNLVMVGMNIITPVHSYESSAELLHDRLVGSNSIKSETGLSNFTKEKQYFPDGVDLGKSKIKWQKIWLTSDVTASTYVDLTDPGFRFDNLVIGKTYRIILHVYALGIANDSGSAVHVRYGNGIVIGQVAWGGRGTVAGTHEQTREVNVIFTADDTSIRFFAVSLDLQINGGAHDSETWATLEELPNHIETDEW